MQKANRTESIVCVNYFRIKLQQCFFNLSSNYFIALLLYSRGLIIMRHRSSQAITITRNPRVHIFTFPLGMSLWTVNYLNMNL